METVDGFTGEALANLEKVYENNGYRIRKEVPGEYVLRYNPETLEKVRIFPNGQVWEF